MKIIHNQTDVNGFWSAGSAGQLQPGLESPLPSCHNSVKICRPHVNIMNIMQYAMHEFMWNFHRIIILCSLTIDNC